MSAVNRKRAPRQVQQRPEHEHSAEPSGGEKEGAQAKSVSGFTAIQTNIGNRATLRLLRNGSGICGADLSHARLQRDTPTAAPAAPAPAAPAAKNDSTMDVGEAVLFDGDLIGTVDQGFRWLDKRGQVIQNVLDEFAGQSMEAPANLVQLQADGEALMDDLLLSDADQIPDVILENIFDWGDRYVAALKSADQQMENLALSKMMEFKSRLLEFIQQLEASEPDLREMQRSAFRKGSEEMLTGIANTFATYLDSALVAKDWIETATTTYRDISYLGTTLRAQTAMHNLPIPWDQTMTAVKNQRVTKFLGAAEKLNKVLASFQLLKAGLEVLSGGKTASDSGKKGVSLATTFASAGGTLLGASAFFSLYNNFYIGPMTEKILAQLSVVEDLISTGQNRPLIEWGKLDWVNWDLEPGGRAMFDYMTKVMQASSGSQIPSPSGDVAEYFDDNMDDFNAGAIGSDNLPTEGWIFSSLDEGEAKWWIFKHRKDIWGMLYGKLRPPS